MTRVRVEGFTISLDGYGAGPNQDIRNPLGVGGTDLHQWLVPTRTFQRTLFGADGGTTGIDDDFAARGFKNVGAWILGRNMFGPIRGAWPDMNWKGWWGDNPPYHVPTFILTHHAARPSRWKAERHSTSLQAVFTRRLTGRATQRTEWTCALAAELTPSGSIFVRALLTSCTSPFLRCCWDGASGCSRGLTFGPRDTNASSSPRRRRLPT